MINGEKGIQIVQNFMRHFIPGTDFEKVCYTHLSYDIKSCYLKTQDPRSQFQLMRKRSLQECFNVYLKIESPSNDEMNVS